MQLTFFVAGLFQNVMRSVARNSNVRYAPYAMSALSKNSTSAAAVVSLPEKISEKIKPGQTQKTLMVNVAKKESLDNELMTKRLIIANYHHD